MLIQKELFGKLSQTKIEKRDYWVTQERVFHNRLFLLCLNNNIKDSDSLFVKEF